MRGHFGRRGHHHPGHFADPDERVRRVLGHGDLRYVISSLLEEKPRHGYELIKSLEELSSGAYSPSPGAIYPTLTFLEEGGFATAEADGNKKLYSITKDGRKHLDENRDFLKELLKRFEAAGERMSKFKHWMGKETMEGVARDERASIRRSMHALKAELFHFTEATKDTKGKIVIILDKAAAEIRKLKE